MKVLPKLSLLSLSLIFLLSIGCQQQHDMEKITVQVNEINDLMTKSMLDNDSEAMLKLYTDDAISMPSYQPMMKGMEAFKENIKNQLPMEMKSFTITSTDILVSGNFVVDIGTYDLVMKMADGEVPDKGKYLTLFEIQKDGSLLIKVETWNTDFNPWEMMMEHQEGAEKPEKK
jgi:ketosteroid isomerase-like protein